MNNNDKKVTILLAPDAVCVQGDDSLTWIRSGGMIIAKAEKGLVVHKGSGWYEGTPALDRLQTFAETTA